MTFFGSFKSRFEDVPGGEDGPATALFLNSCAEIVGVFSERSVEIVRDCHALNRHLGIDCVHTCENGHQRKHQGEHDK